MNEQAPYDFEFFRPEKGYGKLELEVMGARSMAPFFKKGDTIVVHETPFHEIVIGDVVVFHTPHAVCAHRVVKILQVHGSRSIIPKADSYLVSDKAIDSTAYIGKVVSIRSKEKCLSLEVPLWQILFSFVAFCSNMQVILNSICTLVPSTLRRR